MHKLEMEPQQADRVTRRKALKIMVSSAGAAVSLPVLGAAVPESAVPRCHVAAPAGPVAPAAAYTPKFFNSEQIRSLEALTETIIPAADHSPGARAARVREYIDEIVADSGQSEKELWKKGLAAMNELAVHEYGKEFAECWAEQQIALLEKASRNEEKPLTIEERFFVEIKKATIDGYYTSAIGIHQDLQYQGNTALLEFPGCTHPEHKAG